jgi:hypothetical protein
LFADALFLGVLGTDALFTRELVRLLFAEALFTRELVRLLFAEALFEAPFETTDSESVGSLKKFPIYALPNYVTYFTLP